MKKYRLIGTPCFQVESVSQSKEYIIQLLNKNQGGYSTAINAEKIMMYSKDPEMKGILDNSVLPVPDGSGAVLAFKFLHKIKCIRLDLPKTIFEIAHQEDYALFILGASENNNELAVKELQQKYPRINIVGRASGFFKDEKEIIEQIRSTNARIVLVALGSPKQEKFASSVNKALPHILFIGCGGALDILAGKVKRAPHFYQKNHLEWLYRLASDPQRIKRQKILPIYLGKLLLETVKLKINK